MPTITTDDGATFYVPEPIRQELAMPLPVARYVPEDKPYIPFGSHASTNRRDEWSSDPDRTTRNNDTRTSEQVTADAFPIGTRVRTIVPVWHGYTHPAGIVGTIVSPPYADDPPVRPPGRSCWIRQDLSAATHQDGRLMNPWPWEIEAI